MEENSAITPAACLDTLQSAFPELRVSSAEQLEGGQNGVVFLVDNTHIFRFPRYQKGVAALARETAVLRVVGSRLSLPVPEPDFVALDDPTPGKAFVGYRYLPGMPLLPAPWARLRDMETERRLARQLGQFLRELHGTDPAEIPHVLSEADTREEWENIYARIQHHLFEHMRPAARQRVARHFEEWLGRNGEGAYRPVLRHGDFGTGNILFDVITRSACGVLDFAGCTVGDPAVDVAGLANSFGPGFARLLTTTYPEVSGMMERVAFYQEAFVLLEALFGAENDDPEAFTAGISAYQ